MRDACSDVNSAAFKHVELDAEGDISVSIQFKWDQVVEFAGNGILDDFGKLAVESSLQERNALVVAVDGSVVFDASSQSVVKG